MLDVKEMAKPASSGKTISGAADTHTRKPSAILLLEGAGKPTDESVGICQAEFIKSSIPARSSSSAAISNPDSSSSSARKPLIPTAR